MHSGGRKGRILLTVAIYLAIGLVSLLHYVAPVHAHHLHDVYRRLYYLPIILAAFLHGWRGGMVAALVVCAAYLPHAAGKISHDPATDTQKALEMVLYLTIGLTTGLLVSRLQRAQRELEGSLEQLRAAEAELVQSARLAAVGRLSAGLAHEIRNPLASIKGSAEILGDDFPAEHPKRRLLGVLVQESSRLNDVLTRFLSFARPPAIERGTLDLVQELQAVTTLLSAQREGQAARIVLETAETDRAAIQGDREQLRQVFLNLVLNGCQAAGDGGIVRVRIAPVPAAWKVLIHDSGPGFTQEAMENLFTPFFTTRREGTGLGLAISHRIVESHGGTISAWTDPEGGGVVEVVLPR